MKKYNYSMHHQWIHETRMGLLKPNFIQEVYPGDQWKGKSTGIFRLAPMDYPAYMSMKIHQFFFFVPYEMIFPEFPDVITGADTVTAWPERTTTLIDQPKLADYGIGLNTTMGTVTYNELPIRAMNKIWNDIFRNHLTTNEVAEDYVGPLRVNFKNSYHADITTEIQQGSEEIVEVQSGTPDFINTTEMRDSMNRQRMRERRARYGERYVDLLRSYGVKPRNAELDRPVMLAKGSTTMGISEVVATATSAGENTGEYRGHGIAGMTTKFRERYFAEHGLIMGCFYATPRLQLRNKVDKIWFNDSIEEMYHPELASDTQVPVLNTEIYSDNAVHTAIGYQSRDEWLRKPPDVIAGNMMDAANEGWHSHVDLSSTPTIPFMQQVQDYDFLFQDQTASRMDVHCYFDHKIGKRSIIKPRKR